MNRKFDKPLSLPILLAVTAVDLGLIGFFGGDLFNTYEEMRKAIIRETSSDENLDSLPTPDTSDAKSFILQANPIDDDYTLKIKCDAAKDKFYLAKIENNETGIGSYIIAHDEKVANGSDGKDKYDYQVYSVLNGDTYLFSVDYTDDVILNENLQYMRIGNLYDNLIACDTTINGDYFICNKENIENLFTDLKNSEEKNTGKVFKKTK